MSMYFIISKKYTLNKESMAMALEHLIYDKGWIQKLVGWIELTCVGGFSGGR